MCDIREQLIRNGIPFPEELPAQLDLYLNLLKEWNTRMDLIAPAEDAEIIDRHFIDSLCVLKTGLIPEGARFIDVGTGAGFPGLVMAMARPDLRITLMDAQRKRISFLEETVRQTGIRNTEIIHSRAEDAARKKEYREQFDIAAARAVAPLNTLCEYLLPFVRIGGLALCWKGPAVNNELECGRRAAHLLGGRLEMPVRCPVEGREWDHLILPVRKTEKTAAGYPRRSGLPKAAPLASK